MKNKRIFVLLAFCLYAVFVFGQTKIACIGNSITYGHGIENRDKNSYPAQLQTQMGKTFEVKNFGVSARTMLKNGNRPYWNEKEFELAKSFEPDIVIIMLGTNDSKLTINWKPFHSEFEDDYKDMVNTFTNLPSSPHIYVCRVVPAIKSNWEITDSIITTGINPLIEKVAFDKGINLIDLYTSMSKPEWFLDDGIHPNKKGASQMAKYISDVLLQEQITISKKKNNRLLVNTKALSYQWYYNGSPISDKNGGQKRKLKLFGPGKYKVVVQPENNTITRYVSKTATVE